MGCTTVLRSCWREISKDFICLFKNTWGQDTLCTHLPLQRPCIISKITNLTFEKRNLGKMQKLCFFCNKSSNNGFWLCIKRLHLSFLFLSFWKHTRDGGSFPILGAPTNSELTLEVFTLYFISLKLFNLELIISWPGGSARIDRWLHFYTGRRVDGWATNREL